MKMTRSAWALGATGLVAGAALGVTGFAHAASPSPSPARPGHPGFMDRGGHPGGPFGFRFKGERAFGYGGLVTSLSDSSISVRTPQGVETVGLNGSTTYYQGRTKATRSAVKPGEVVRIRLADPQASKKVAAVVTVVPAHLAGWVKDVSGDTITITDQDGFTRTIRTSSATTYEKDGSSATSSIVTAGTLIRAVGSVDADGTTLDATTVSVGRPAVPGGPGMPGMPGMDRPGMPGMGDGGAPGGTPNA